MKGEGSVVQGERRGVAGAACVALLWMGVWEATWGRERTLEHDRVAWESVECTVAAEVEAYLNEFPEGRYVKEARACLDDLGLGRDEEEEWAERERRLELSREERRRIQEALEGLGLELGGVDGWFGERTREAIRRWEASRGREETGYLDVEGARELLALGEERERARLEAERKKAEAEAVGSRFRDCEECPELVVVGAGEYRMGSPESEEGRVNWEGPVHGVKIGERLAVGVYEVTVGQWRRFVEATGYSAGDGCWTYEGGEWEERSGRNWERPGFVQGEGHPVVCVSWEDAQAYVSWLSRKTGEEYRLLSESEWEYVARGGTRSARYWGEGERGQCRNANGADEAAKRQYNWVGVASCDDGYVHTSPVGRFKANGFGLHDVHGNVWEWVEDCWNRSYEGAPADGSAWTRGNCGARVLRGGSWDNDPRYLRSAYRNRLASGGRDGNVGVRIVRTL